jgi:hypothetical protein
MWPEKKSGLMMNELFEETMLLFNECIEGRVDLNALFLTSGWSLDAEKPSRHQD